MKRLALLLGVLVGSMTALGCRDATTRCEDICIAADDCGDSYDIDVCVDECVRDAEDADDGCTTSYQALADCAATENHDCPDIIDACDSEIEDFWDDCDDDFKNFEYADPFMSALDGTQTPL
jgi:hypothetical protein